jgi:AraC family transcriptional regulator
MDEMLRALANEIRKMLLAPFPGDALHAETLSRAAAGHLVRHYASERHVSVKPVRGLTSEQCNRAIEYIEECLGDNLSVARIAKAAGVSASRLNNEFKRRTKLAPHQYVLNARVRRANTLLTTTDMSLAEIAFQCGFSNQQHMTRMVRRLTGRTPGNIRRDR